MVRVEINMVEGDHSVIEKLDFMKKATEAVVRILHCPPEEVRVTIQNTSERMLVEPASRSFRVVSKVCLRSEWTCSTQRSQ